MTTLDPRALEMAAKIRANQDTPDFINASHYRDEAAEIITAYLAALSQPQAGEPIVDRQRCVDLHQKLGRDAMLRQNDPVQTIYDFAASVWQEGFAEGYREDGHTSDTSPQPANPVQVTDAIERLRKNLADFDDEVAAELSTGGDRADLWTEIDVNVEDLRAALSTAPATADGWRTQGAVADQIIGQIEERFPNWRSYRDLIDCIDCTLAELRRVQA